MPVLYLSAPNARTQMGAFYKSFNTILANGVGPDYGINANLIGLIHAGDMVVVFDRDQQLRAEGVVATYSPKGKAGNNVQRYDVHIHSLTVVPYTNPPRVNRFGVAVI
jgi:hypothetical protein